MKIGYARSSDAKQINSIEWQTEALEMSGCTRMFSEHASAFGEREALEEAIEFAREGDSIVITRLDRLTREAGDLRTLTDRLDAKGVGLQIMEIADGDLNMSSPTIGMLLTILTGYSQFEREVMMVRQRPGIDKAKEQGKYKGRAPTARAKSDEVLGLSARGIGASVIAKAVGISRASVYRIVNEAELAQSPPSPPPRKRITP